jgi:hypothetical protein
MLALDLRADSPVRAEYAFSRSHVTAGKQRGSNATAVSSKNKSRRSRYGNGLVVVVRKRCSWTVSICSRSSSSFTDIRLARRLPCDKADSTSEVSIGRVCDHPRSRDTARGRMLPKKRARFVERNANHDNHDNHEKQQKLKVSNSHVKNVSQSQYHRLDTSSSTVH